MYFLVGLLLLAGRFVLSFSSLANPTVVNRRQAAARKLDELRQEKETFTSIGKVESRIPAGLDITALLHEEKNSPAPKFVHAQPLIASLRRGEETFEVVEHNVDVDEWDSNDNDDKGRALFETTTSYNLKASPDNYLNLDDINDEDAPLHIRGLSADHILHCGRALESGLLWRSGSIVLGTERGAWSRIPHVSRHLDETFSSLHTNHAAGRRKHGFLVLRRITEVHATDDADCTKIHTEPVHPIELFEKFRVESLGLRPYNHNYGNYEVATDQNQEQATVPERKLFSTYAKPDSPIMKCTDQSFAPFTSGTITGNYGLLIPSTPAATDDQLTFAAEISVNNGGCIEYSKEFSGGFNFNYNPSTKGAITQSLPLGGTSIAGVTCEGCYAYLGAGFLLIFEYTSDRTISAEGKIAGATGINANVNIVDPTISGSVSVKLVRPETTWTSIELGTGSGLSFQYKFGGLTALVSGSVTATGTASFGAGLSVSASIANKYASGAFSYPHSFTESSVTPYFTSTGFTATSVSLSTTLTGTENFGLVYSTLLTVSFLFDGSVDGTVTYLMGTALSSKSTAQVVVVPPSVLSTPGRSLSGSDDKGAGYFMPGDSMTIQFAYDGYPSQEAITLFYSFTKTSGDVMNIMMRHFNTSATGTGVLEATWLVPWDEFLSEEWPQKESQITVKASTDISKEYTSTSGFGVKIFTEVDGIFSSPAPGEMVPVDTPYEVKWNSSLLKTFVPNAWNRPDGKMVVADSVVLELCGEALATNGTILSSWCDNFEHDRPHLNVGGAQVVFSSNLATRADRFYLNVHSHRHLSVYGWSPGYFRLITGRVSSATLANLRVANVDVSSPKVLRRQTPRTESSPLTEAKRKLASQVACSDSAATSSVSFGSNLGCTPRALSLSLTSGILDYTYNVPLQSNSVISVVDPAAICYGDLSAPTFTPTTFAPQTTFAPTPSAPSESNKNIITTIAGTGTAGSSGDGGAATSAQLNYPLGVSVDISGNVYIADASNHKIRMVTSTGTITTFAGTGLGGFSGDGGAATSAQLYYPYGVSVDISGKVYIADYVNNRIRMVTSSGTITTFAGSGTYGSSGDGAAATSAQLIYPRGLSVDISGNVYIADLGNSKIRMVTRTGIITTIAGTGVQGRSDDDGGAATSAQLFNPSGVSVDISGNVYIADWYNNKIRMVTSSGIITTIAGTGAAANLWASNGDGGAATSALLSSAYGVSVDLSGNVYIADDGSNRIRMVTSSGTITTIAGPGSSFGNNGDGGAATSAQLYNPKGVSVDISGKVYIADYGNHEIRMVVSQSLTSSPSPVPTPLPTTAPVPVPSPRPTSQPSKQPTQQPTRVPSRQPSSQPTRQPTQQPTGQPTQQPSIHPSRQPINRPTGQPTQQPSMQPSSRPTSRPTAQPLQISQSFLGITTTDAIALFTTNIAAALTASLPANCALGTITILCVYDDGTTDVCPTSLRLLRSAAINLQARKVTGVSVKYVVIAPPSVSGAAIASSLSTSATTSAISSSLATSTGLTGITVQAPIVQNPTNAPSHSPTYNPTYSPTMSAPIVVITVTASPIAPPTTAPVALPSLLAGGTPSADASRGSSSSPSSISAGSASSGGSLVAVIAGAAGGLLLLLGL